MNYPRILRIFIISLIINIVACGPFSRSHSVIPQALRPLRKISYPFHPCFKTFCYLYDLLEK